MAEQVSRSPMPVMGQRAMEGSLVNMSGQRSPNTRPGPGAGGPGKSTSPDGPPAAHPRMVLLDPSKSGPVELPLPTPGNGIGTRGEQAGAQHAVQCHRAAQPEPEDRGVLIAADHDRRSPMWNKRFGGGY